MRRNVDPETEKKMSELRVEAREALGRPDADAVTTMEVSRYWNE